MEDRYLFKANRIDNEKWVIGFYTYIHEKHYIYTGQLIHSGLYDVAERFEVDPSTICRCTGMKDKNGNLIFDNDIVNAMSFNTAGKPIHVDDIVVNMSDYNLMLGLDSVNVLERVGNIFDKEMKENG